MTTLKIDDELGKRATEFAAAQGKTLEQFVGELLQRAVSAPKRVQQIERNGLPVMIVPEETPVIDADRVQRIIDEEGF